MTLKLAANKTIGPTVFVSPVGVGDPSAPGKDVSNPTTLDSIWAKVLDPDYKILLDSSNYLTLVLADGTYQTATSYSLEAWAGFACTLRVQGNTSNPQNVSLIKTSGSAGFFRAVGAASLFINGCRVENSNGDGLAVSGSGSNLYAFNIVWGDISFDHIFADDGGTAFVQGTHNFAVASTPDTFVRTREDGIAIYDCNLEFNGLTVTFVDAIFDTISGTQRGSISWNGAANVSGNSWDESEGGQITLGGRFKSDLFLVGDFVFQSRNDYSNASKLLSLVRVPQGIDFTYTNQNIFDTFWEPFANIVVKYDFTPSRGWNHLVWNKNPQFSVTLTDTNDAVIGKLGRGYPYLSRLVWDGIEWQLEPGGSAGSRTGFTYIGVNDGSTGDGEMELRLDLGAIYFDTEDAFGQTITPTLERLGIGSWIILEAENDPEFFSVLEMTETPTIAPNFVTQPVFGVDGAATVPANDTVLKVRFIPRNAPTPSPVERGETLILYMGVGVTADDNNLGRSPLAPVRGFVGLNEALKRIRLNGMNDIAGEVPTVHVLMEAGTYEGGEICYPQEGCGRILINEGEEAVVIDSALLIHSIPPSIALILFEIEHQITGGLLSPYSTRYYTAYTYTTTTTSPTTATTTVSVRGVESERRTPSRQMRDLLATSFGFNPSEAPSSAIAFLAGPVDVTFNRCTFNDTVNTVNSAPVFAMGGTTVTFESITHKGTYPIILAANSVNIFFNGEQVFDSAILHTFRFLVSCESNCNVWFEDTLRDDSAGGNLDIEYLVRMIGGGSIALRYNAFNPSGILWAEAPSLAIIDDGFSGEGILVSDRGFKNQLITKRPLEFTVSATLNILFYAGIHATFDGGGVVGTIILEREGQSEKVLTGMNMRVSALNGASIQLDNVSANLTVYVNNTVFTDVSPVLNSTGQTTIDIYQTSPGKMIVNILEGALA